MFQSLEKNMQETSWMLLMQGWADHVICYVSLMNDCWTGVVWRGVSVQPEDTGDTGELLDSGWVYSTPLITQLASSENRDSEHVVTSSDNSGKCLL